MACHLQCDYTTRQSVTQQVKTFVWHTSCYAVVAMSVNAIFMYFLRAEDLNPSLINGGSAALSLNTIHKLSHVVRGERVDDDKLVKTVRLSLVALVNYLVLTHLLETWKYELTNSDMFRQTLFSYVGIMGFTYYLKVQKERKGA